MWEESLLYCVWGYNNTLSPLSAQESVTHGLDFVLGHQFMEDLWLWGSYCKIKERIWKIEAFAIIPA